MELNMVTVFQALHQRSEITSGDWCLWNLDTALPFSDYCGGSYPELILLELLESTNFVCKFSIPKHSLLMLILLMKIR
jgi:hypothetical protein